MCELDLRAEDPAGGHHPEGSSAHLDQIDIPFVTVQNLSLFNLHQFGSYELFEKARTPEGRRWLILGPREYDLPAFGWQEEALAFFDHVLHGLDNGYAEQLPVRSWVEGAETFVASVTFPPASAERLRLELATGGDDRQTHRLLRHGAGDGSKSWAAVPIGMPVLGGLDDVVT